MRESGDQGLIFFTIQGGSFISALDAMRQRFDGLVRGDEMVLRGCSWTVLR